MSQSWGDQVEEEKKEELRKSKEIENNLNNRYLDQFEKLSKIIIVYSDKIKIFNDSDYSCKIDYTLDDDEYFNIPEQIRSKSDDRRINDKHLRYFWASKGETILPFKHDKMYIDGEMLKMNEQKIVPLRCVKIDFKDDSDFRNYFYNKFNKDKSVLDYTKIIRNNGGSSSKNMDNSSTINRLNNDSKGEGAKELDNSNKVSESQNKVNFVKLKIRELTTYCFENDIEITMESGKNEIRLKINY